MAFLCILSLPHIDLGVCAVSYTHLDVYKRQIHSRPFHFSFITSPFVVRVIVHIVHIVRVNVHAPHLP